MKTYLKEHPTTKFVSITARQSLSAQHMLSFKDIEMQNYQDRDTDPYEAKALTICINSLCKLIDLTDEEMSNYIVFIDEVSSFLELTHNDTLDHVLKHVYRTLIRFIKNAKKVIVSDALITDAVFELLKHRADDTKIYVKNKFKKYDNIKAVRMRDEEAFLNKIL